MAKKKSGKVGRTSGKSKSMSGRKGTGKHKKATGRSKSISARNAPVKHRPSGHELIPVVCSECFEEFSFDTGVRSDSLTCPVCEHSASRPDDGTLHRISGLRKSEGTNFMITFILAVVGLSAFGSFAVVQSNPANAMDDAMFWGPIGVGALCAFILMGFIVKYEGNRWETYF